MGLSTAIIYRAKIFHGEMRLEHLLQSDIKIVGDYSYFCICLHCAFLGELRSEDATFLQALLRDESFDYSILHTLTASLR